MNYFFDLDDTLVHTSEIVFRSMNEWCVENAIDIGKAIEHGKGRRTEDTVAILAPHLNAKLEAKKIEKREEELLQFIQPLSGALEFVLNLPESNWGVVTSSSHDLAMQKIRICGYPIPKILVSAESVERGKPSPDPYLKAAQLMGVNPGDCFVFEDAESGIESAFYAGCKVIAVGEYRGKFDENIYGRIETFDQLEFAQGDLFGTEKKNT